MCRGALTEGLCHQDNPSKSCAPAHSGSWLLSSSTFTVSSEPSWLRRRCLSSGARELSREASFCDLDPLSLRRRRRDLVRFSVSSACISASASKGCSLSILTADRAECGLGGDQSILIWSWKCKVEARKIRKSRKMMKMMKMKRMESDGGR